MHYVSYHHMAKVFHVKDTREILTIYKRTAWGYCLSVNTHIHTKTYKQS